MQSLEADADDLYVYACALYDVCVLAPCVSVAWQNRASGRCVGAQVGCLAGHFKALQVPGRCGAHAALCKHFHTLLTSSQQAQTDRALFQSIFSGLREDHQGIGLFPIMHDTLMQNQIAAGCPWSWGFTFNPAILVKSMKGKEGMPGGMMKRRLVPDIAAEVWAERLCSLPVSLLKIIRHFAVRRGVVPRGAPLLVEDVAEFSFKGRHPFKTSRICWIIMYNANPKESGECEAKL